jgi:hypothetical protein
MKTVLATIGAVLLTLGIGLGVAGAERRQSLCQQIGLCQPPDLMGAMLASVQRQRKLLVLEARLVVPVTSARETTLGPITVATTRQTAILPGTVAYTLDLTRMAPGDLRWEKSTETITVIRPKVTIEEPAILWQQAQVYGDDNWVTAMTDVQERLRRDNEVKAPARFRDQASAPDLVALADDAADRALATTFTMPLVAAGFPNARVLVRSR